MEWQGESGDEAAAAGPTALDGFEGIVADFLTTSEGLDGKLFDIGNVIVDVIECVGEFMEFWVVVIVIVECAIELVLFLAVFRWQCSVFRPAR